VTTKKERSAAAAVLGRKGGRSRSPAKLAAVAQNAKRGGRPSRYLQGWRDAMVRAEDMVRAQEQFEMQGSLLRKVLGELADCIAAEPPPKKEG
jgi:hypothetical protein